MVPTEGSALGVQTLRWDAIDLHCLAPESIEHNRNIELVIEHRRGHRPGAA